MKRSVSHTTSALRGSWVLVVMVALFVALLASTTNAWDENPNPGVLPPGSNPYGQSYGQWAAQWWTWVLSIPEEVNPLFDETGEFADIGQSGPVWFLVGATEDATITRNVEIPAGKALFFPLVNIIWIDNPEDHPFDEESVRFILAFVMDSASASCEIDGRPVQNIEAYRQQSPVFDLPEDNFYGYPVEPPPPPGNPNGYYGPCVDEGYYLFLAPLPVGEHTIHFHSYLGFFDVTLDITYNITVVPPQ